MFKIQNILIAPNNFLFRYCDEGMVEAVTTLIWAAPRLQSDVQELRVVSNSLTYITKAKKKLLQSDEIPCLRLQPNSPF